MVSKPSSLAKTAVGINNAAIARRTDKICRLVFILGILSAACFIIISKLFELNYRSEVQFEVYLRLASRRAALYKDVWPPTQAAFGFLRDIHQPSKTGSNKLGHLERERRVSAAKQRDSPRHLRPGQVSLPSVVHTVPKRCPRLAGRMTL